MRCLALGNRAAVAFMLLPTAAYAGADQPWNESADGGGSVPAVALSMGLAAAAYFAVDAFRRGASIGETLYAAYLGMTFGLVIGLPVACAFG